MAQSISSFVRLRAVLFTLAVMSSLVSLIGPARGADPAAAPDGENTANAREPTLEERIAAYFGPRNDLAKTFEQAQKFDGPQALRVMLIVGDPKSYAARGYVSFLNDRSEPVKPYELLSDFEQLTVSAEDKPAMEVLQTKYGLKAEQLTPLSLVALDGNGGVLASMKLPNERIVNGDKLSVALREFTTAHALPRPDSKAILAAACDQARREGKCVLLEESGAYCGWCRVLSRFFDRHADIFDAHFVPVRMDRSRFANGEEVMKQYRATEGGIPWCAILDADGKKLADWDTPDGNMGYPTLPKEFDHLERILKQAAPEITKEQLAEMRADLEREAKRYAQP
jgi:hypothetical protein